MDQQGILSYAKKLTQESLDPIADYRPPYPRTDRDAEPIGVSFIGFADDNKVGGGDSSPLAR